MLYASTRASLLKSLGSTSFTDSLFATSKADLTPEAYNAHLKHMAAPKPLSAREQEMADIRAAERVDAPAYEGSRARTSIIGTGVGLNWTSEVESAVEGLGKGEEGGIVIVVRLASSYTRLKTSESGIRSPSTLPVQRPSFYLRHRPQR